MRINEFDKKITAQALNESAAQMFGQHLNLESFTLEQMMDARNKLRTKVSQYESTASYDAVFEDETLAKNKMFLTVLNQAIEEREAARPTFTEMEQMVLSKVEEGVIAFEDLPEELQEKVAQERKLTKGEEKKREEYVKGMKKSKGDFEQRYGDRGEEVMYATATKMAKKESVEESVLREGEEEKAELIMASRDMVDRVTGWMEDTANMQAESMLELIDSIRDEMGHEMAMDFESVVKPALATIYTALESSRQQLTQGVGILTGEEQGAMMGAEEPVEELPPEEEEADEFAAAAASAGGEEAAGRAQRESIEYSRKLANILAPKKK